MDEIESGALTPEPGPPDYPGLGYGGPGHGDGASWLLPLPEGQLAVLVEAPAQARRSRWWNIALALLAVAVLSVAVSLLVTARRASSDASAATAQAMSMNQSRDDLDTQQRQVDDRRRAMDTATSALDAAMVRLEKSMTDAAEAQHHLVDVHTRAADLWNARKRGETANLAKTDGAAALADLDQKTTAVDKAMTDLQAATRDLQVKFDG